MYRVGPFGIIRRTSPAFLHLWLNHVHFFPFQYFYSVEDCNLFGVEINQFSQKSGKEVSVVEGCNGLTRSKVMPDY